jgi:MFS family permease
VERFFEFHIKDESRMVPSYLTYSFRAAAVAVLSLFSPVFIYKTLLRITGQDNLALLSVFVYFLGIYICKFVANLIAEELALRRGLKKQIRLSLFLAALCIATQSLAGNWPLLLVFSSLFWGLSAGLYWFSQHAMVAKSCEDGTFGRKLGLMEVVRILLLLVVPLAAGVLIDAFGYPIVFLLSLVFIGLSALATVGSPEMTTHIDTSLKEVIEIFKTHKKSVLIYVGSSVAGTVYGVTIPLYLYLILKKELSLGEFFSLVMVFQAVIYFIIGRWSDIKGKRGLVIWGSLSQFFIWFGRWLTVDVGALFIFDILDRFTTGMIGIPLTAISYEKAIEGQSTGRATLFRETAITLTEICVCLLLVGMVLLHIPLRFAFLLAAGFSLLTAGLARRVST